MTRFDGSSELRRYPRDESPSHAGVGRVGFDPAQVVGVPRVQDVPQRDIEAYDLAPRREPEAAAQVHQCVRRRPVPGTIECLLVELALGGIEPRLCRVRLAADRDVGILESWGPDSLV